MGINRRDSKKPWTSWKNIAPLRKFVDKLPNLDDIEVEILDNINISSKNISKEQKDHIHKTAQILKPWRKGPFEVCGTFIDSEWKSYIKFNRLISHVNLENKIVADVGCNNGYYMFRMLEFNPKKIVGFDPSPVYRTQFDFINHFIKSDIKYELLGIEDVASYNHKFDVIFCLGVLYHRSDPVQSLKDLKNSLNQNGEVILDTFIIDGDEEIVLSPKKRYMNIPNITFVPTIQALQNWCFRAGFQEIEILGVYEHSSTEQRRTNWVDTQSLEDFLDPNDSTLTIEGYKAPKRAYMRLQV